MTAGAAVLRRNVAHAEPIALQSCLSNAGVQVGLGSIPPKVCRIEAGSPSRHLHAPVARSCDAAKNKKQAWRQTSRLRCREFYAREFGCPPDVPTWRFDRN